jgi:hypothetical protein
VTDIDNVEDQASKRRQVVLSLLGVLLEEATKEEMQGLGKSGDVNNSEALQGVVRNWFAHEETGHGGNHVKHKVSEDVVISDVTQLFVCTALLDEVQEDLNKVDDVKGQVYSVESLVFPYSSSAGGRVR